METFGFKLEIAGSVYGTNLPLEYFALSALKEPNDISWMYDSKFTLIKMNIILASLFDKREIVASNYKPDEWVDNFFLFINYFNRRDFNPELPQQLIVLFLFFIELFIRFWQRWI